MSARDEVEEHVHHAEDPFDKMVAATMAIIAALLAVTSVLGQHYTKEELLMQAKASDQWAYYQAKDTRRFSAEAARDMMGELRPGSPTSARYDQQAGKYRADAKEIQDIAHEYEHESERAGRKSERFHSGEIFLEIAIVFSSLAILSKTKLLYFGGLACAVAGAIISVTAYLL
jgi:hypothetical protein